MSQPASRRQRRLAAASSLALVVAVGALAVPAATFARSGDGVTKAGSCSASSTYELKAKHDDGRIEVEFEVDQNRNNRTWTVRIWDNGVRVYAGSAVTRAPSGSFTVVRRIANRAGIDVIGARAINAATGEVCRATIRI